MLRDLIRMTAISIPSNLAEGEESGSEKASFRHFNIANTSLEELKVQMEKAKDVGCISEPDYEPLKKSMKLLSKRIISLLPAP